MDGIGDWGAVLSTLCTRQGRFISLSLENAKSAVRAFCPFYGANVAA